MAFHYIRSSHFDSSGWSFNKYNNIEVKCERKNKNISSIQRKQNDVKVVVPMFFIPIYGRSKTRLACPPIINNIYKVLFLFTFSPCLLELLICPCICAYFLLTHDQWSSDNISNGVSLTSCIDCIAFKAFLVFLFFCICVCVCVTYGSICKIRRTKEKKLKFKPEKRKKEPRSFSKN